MSFWCKCNHKDTEKVSDTSSYTRGFEDGLNRAWDLLIPIMTDGIDKVKKKIFEQATDDAIKRFNSK